MKTKNKHKQLADLMDKKDCGFSLNFSISKGLELNSSDPYDHVDFINGDILRTSDSQNEDSVGYIKLRRFRLDNAYNNKIHYYDLFDCVESETEALYSTIFDEETYEIKRSIQDEVSINQILHIQRMELLPEFRGTGLGFYAASKAIETFGSYDTLVTTNPFPLQYEGKEYNVTREDYDKKRLAKEEKDAFSKVIKFWKSVGFKQIKKSKFYYMTLF